jgi:ABC-type enterochelin transport system substrate-binding protein
MKKVGTVLACLLLTACATTTPKVMPYQQGAYMVSNEAEFNVTEMVNGVYEAAHKKCTSEGKEVSIIKAESGHGGIGAFGPKSGFGLIFRCI